jgi:hypothetical protein
MSFDRQKGQELVEQAEEGTWSLECDEKLLGLMQNVASVSKFHDFPLHLILLSFRFFFLHL